MENKFQYANCSDTSANIWITAVYIRLSKEDIDKKDESNSITNQKSLINDFLKGKSEFTVHDYYIDDGYTGTDFLRPNFERMIKAIKAGEVNCIVVKDMSRFGRDYIGIGEYLEKILPMYDVRFVAINDNIDTEYKMNIDIAPFKAVFNDMYSNDISKKVKSAKETMARNGKFYGSFAPYGYKKDAKDKHRLAVDEESAWVIRKIFKYAMDGLGAVTIAKKLNSEGIPPPVQYKKSKGFNYKHSSNIEVKPLWGRTQIKRILENEVYIGNLVQHKSRKISYKMKVCKERDKSEYIVVPKTHEPIISPEVWQKVNSLKGLVTRKLASVDMVHDFAGIIKCGECSRAMKRKYSAYGEKNARVYYFVCSTRSKCGENTCSNNKGIRENLLREIVLDDIKKEIEIALTVNEIAEIINNKREITKSGNDVNIHIKVLEEKLQKLYRLKKEMYIDYKDGMVSREDYIKYKDDCDREEIELAEKLKNAELEKSSEIGRTDMRNTWVGKLKDCGNITELNRELILEFIENIYVYEGKRIKIKYKHRNELLGGLEQIYASSYGTNAPLNWTPGLPLVIPPPSTYQELKERIQNPQGYSCMDWYLCMKPDKKRELSEGTGPEEQAR